MQNVALVALGGLLGAVARYGMQGLVYRLAPVAFPVGTLAVNVAGCFLVGVFLSLAQERMLLSAAWRIFLTTGFCGGFTTFSTFSYETVALLQDGQLLYAGLYAGSSVVLGLGATVLGLVTGRLA